MRAAAALACALALAGPAAAATATTGTAGAPSPVTPSFPPADDGPRLNEKRAVAIFVADAKVAGWLDRYPPDPTTDADYDKESGAWTVKVWSGDAGQVALGKVDDESGAVTEAWTGPQVAWKMARGYSGAFGGRTINSPPVWLAFCALFVLGLADLRRPLSLRNLDVAALLSFSISLWFFNRGQIFWSVPLAYPPLVYLLARLAWIGARGRAPAPTRPVWPVWLLLAATLFVAGFRVGLNVEASNVIDVGYAGVIGAHRIVDGQAPYGNMPVQDDRPKCGRADSSGEVRERIQRNGRCESSNPRGDTYGPVAYLAYVPGYLLFGWTGKWDSLPAAHFTTIAWDLLTLLGLALVGLRFGGARLAAVLAFAWVSYPFTQYASSSNTNDAIMPALLVWGLWLASRDSARGIFSALAAWSKFASLVTVPLWLTYPGGRPSRGRVLRFLGGFAAATAAAFAVLLLEPDLVEAARVFFERTVGFQAGRESPFSLWGWGQYEADGIPDFRLVQRVLQGLLIAAALAVALVPRRKSWLQLAALTGALLAGFQLVLTHWSYLYLPWLLPFAAIALFSARPEPAPAAEEPEADARDDASRELVAAG